MITHKFPSITYPSIFGLHDVYQLENYSKTERFLTVSRYVTVQKALDTQHMEEYGFGLVKLNFSLVLRQNSCTRLTFALAHSLKHVKL